MANKKSKPISPTAVLERLTKLTARVKRVDALIEGHQSVRGKLLGEADSLREEMQSYLAQMKEGLLQGSNNSEVKHQPVPQANGAEVRVKPKAQKVGKKVKVSAKNSNSWLAHSLYFLAERGTGAFLDDIAAYCRTLLQQGVLSSTVLPTNKDRLKNNVSVALCAAKHKGYVVNNGPFKPWRLTPAGEKHVAFLRGGSVV